MDIANAVSKKMAARIPDVARSPSTTGRAVLFTSYVSSLYAFKAQFAYAQPHVRHEHNGAVRSITKAPWQAFPTQLLTRLKELEFLVEIREFDRITLEAQARTIQWSKVRSATLDMIDKEAFSDDSRLDPTCDWHHTSNVSTVRQTFERIQAMALHVRAAVEEGNKRMLHEFLHAQAGGREGVIRPMLQRRAQRLSADPASR